MPIGAKGNAQDSMLQVSVRAFTTRTYSTISRNETVAHNRSMTCPKLYSQLSVGTWVLWVLQSLRLLPPKSPARGPGSSPTPLLAKYSWILKVLDLGSRLRSPLSRAGGRGRTRQQPLGGQCRDYPPSTRIRSSGCSSGSRRVRKEEKSPNHS